MNQINGIILLDNVIWSTSKLSSCNYVTTQTDLSGNETTKVTDHKSM